MDHLVGDVSVCVEEILKDVRDCGLDDSCIIMK